MANIDDIKKFRGMTGVGVSDAKEALDSSNGDFDKALEYIKAKGLDKQAKKSDREANEGYVGSYIHSNGKIGVLVEVNCETDFVSGTEDFRNFCRDLSLQVAGFNPKYVNRADIPEAEMEELKKAALEGVKTEGKKEDVVNSIIEGKLNKVFSEIVLMDQIFLKDETKTIKQLVSDAVLKFGENIKVKRFVRLQIGE